MMWSTYLLLLFSYALPAFSLNIRAYDSATCVASCSDWSVVLGFCEGVFGNAAAQQGYTVANAFISCLCMGNESNGALGTDAFLNSTSICQGCPRTPVIVQKQLSQLALLCDTQATNGTAADAVSFNPTPYTTSSDSNLLASSAWPQMESSFVAWTVVGVSSLVLGSIMA